MIKHFWEVSRMDDATSTQLPPWPNTASRDVFHVKLDGCRCKLLPNFSIRKNSDTTSIPGSNVPLERDGDDLFNLVGRWLGCWRRVTPRLRGTSLVARNLVAYHDTGFGAPLSNKTSSNKTSGGGMVCTSWHHIKKLYDGKLDSTAPYLEYTGTIRRKISKKR